MSNSNHSRAQRRRHSAGRYWLRRLVVLLLIAIPTLIFAARSFDLSGLLAPIALKPSSSAPAVTKTEPTYVLLMGVDEREHDVGRSDTMMLLRLDPKGERADLINLPRDTRVWLDNSEHVKLNSFYPKGGAESTVSAVGQLLGIPNPYWVEVNMQGFVEIIDALGGVPITLERDYDYEDPYQDLYIHLKAGPQVLGGKQALHFVRLRYDGVGNDDISRIKRQQQFVQALQSKLIAPSNLLKVGDFMTIMRNRIQTNVPQKDQVYLANLLFQSRHQLQMRTLPGQGEDAGSDFLFDAEGWAEVQVEWKQASH
ncbi:MAG TPA: LCP family protein [Symbiobacteriaceae bacterium]|nr:LCP family protein [Symbiobacteriaceae bacterium]